MNGDRATIDDVALRAGVSISTVSNVLNGREDRMRADTLDRVRKAIADLAFHPNQSARRLKTGHMAMIGLLVPTIANPFFGALANWAEAAANAHGYGVLLCNTRRNAEREQAYAQAFLAQGVQGVILGSSLQAQEHLAPLIKRGLAVVSLDRTAQDAPLTMDYVSLDNRRAGAMAAEHLLSLGHTDIAYVSAPLRSISRVERLDGARQACAARNVRFTEHIRDVKTGQTEMEMVELGRAASVELHASGCSATGYIAMNDMLGIGLLSGLRLCNLRVPQDVSVMGIDDIFLDAYLNPALSTVRQPMKDIATAVVERVLTRMKHLDEPAHELVFAPELVQRESTSAWGRVLNSESKTA